MTLHPRGAAALGAVLLGSGTTIFVLSNESDEDLCSWLPFVGELRAHGYSAPLYDYQDPTDLAADAHAGAIAAHAVGADRIILMGASVGARASIKAAGSDRPRIAAVITLSAERAVRSDPIDLTGPARDVRSPTLLVAAREDPYVIGATSPLLRALGSADKRELIVPGLDHGTALLTDSNGPRVRAAILRFVATS
jgi:pimeloyl-ACP methyl ester carboxylesterase